MQQSFPEEIPLAIDINGINLSVMLISPYDIEDFIVGYLHSESIIKFNHEIHNIQVGKTEDSVLVDVTIANRNMVKLNEMRRMFKGSSGCGLCGKESLGFAFPELTTLPPSTPIELSHLSKTRDSIRAYQTLGSETGALHAAVWLNHNSQIEHCREDIGRHNALDKLLGCLIRNKTDLAKGAILVTSRCSAELIQKVVLAKINTLISLASPSTFAIKLANAYNLHLIHVPKHDAPYLVTGEFK